jgi:hypothetical protein
MSNAVSRGILAIGAVVCLAASASAQQTSTSTQTKQFEVIAVNGNQLVVRLPEGTREMTVADDFRFDVDGKQMSVHELKPGMKGTATVTTKTTVTPVTVTEVKNGTVMQASGASIIVRTDDGIKMFTEGDVAKRGIRITRDGKPIAFSSLHAGDSLSATIVTSKPPRVVTEKEVQATLAKASPAAAPAGAAAGAGAAAAPAPAAAATSGTAAPAAAAPRTLPKTASPLPLVGLSGLASLLAAVALTVRRRRLER